MLTYDKRMHLPVQCSWSLGLRLLCTSPLFSPELQDVDSFDTIIHCAYVPVGIVGTVGMELNTIMCINNGYCTNFFFFNTQ
jgi:hypothetical protein